MRAYLRDSQSQYYAELVVHWRPVLKQLVAWQASMDCSHQQVALMTTGLEADLMASQATE